MTRGAATRWCALATFAFMMAGRADATVLTFDVDGFLNFETIDPAYGDNVSATSDSVGSYGVGAEGFTPDITVSYGTPGEDPSLWNSGYGDLTNILFNDQDGDDTLTVELSAGPGFDVVLFDFDLASFSAAGQSIPGFEIRDAGTAAVLDSVGTTVISGTTHESFSFASGAGLQAHAIRIVIDLTGLGTVSDNIGIDNIRFGQVVPEPATALLVGAGLALLGVVRRSGLHRR